jgi:hypothetical protein
VVSPSPWRNSHGCSNPKGLHLFPNVRERKSIVLEDNHKLLASDYILLDTNSHVWNYNWWIVSARPWNHKVFGQWDADFVKTYDWLQSEAASQSGKSKRWVSYSLRRLQVLSSPRPFPSSEGDADVVTTGRGTENWSLRLCSIHSVKPGSPNLCALRWIGQHEGVCFGDTEWALHGIVCTQEVRPEFIASRRAVTDLAMEVSTYRTLIQHHIDS